MNPTRLTVELVPSSSHFDNVRSHVSRAEWDRIRNAVYRRADHTCEICGGRGRKWPVEAHEVWHYDDEAKVQRLAGFQALCPDCHRVKHIGYASTQGLREPAEQHLARVNGWSRQDVRYYTEVVFEQWMRRSQHEWTLDLSYLDRFREEEGLEGGG